MHPVSVPLCASAVSASAAAIGIATVIAIGAATGIVTATPGVTVRASAIRAAMGDRGVMAATTAARIDRKAGVAPTLRAPTLCDPIRGRVDPMRVVPMQAVATHRAPRAPLAASSLRATRLKAATAPKHNRALTARPQESAVIDRSVAIASAAAGAADAAGVVDGATGARVPQTARRAVRPRVV